MSFESATTNDVAAKKAAGLTKAGIPAPPRMVPPPVLAEPERHENRGIPAAPTALFLVNVLATGWAYASHELGGVVPGSLATSLALYLLFCLLNPKRRR
ncbi:hypothetical protein [Streptomyces sp. WAC04657]|uniref:hypothetical protein n=1 Tax=Streptomyces sp. WAC04657 TaxID=1779145 RepID=UPI00131BA040|nr:hypothetical protein [Streptomyces sp. WAC04657]